MILRSWMFSLALPCHTFGDIEGRLATLMAASHGGGRRPANPTLIRARVSQILEAIVRWLGTIVAGLLVVYVVLTVAGANPDNGITRFVRSCAGPLALGFGDLFTPADPKLAVVLNYGIAALFWLFITALAVRILRAVGGR
jgi:hypothetical protein